METRVESRLLEVADTSPETLQAVLEEHGWGDGLPVVPPTDDRVQRMLAAVDLGPDTELGILFPRGGVVTPRVAAVNAVLAGCTPETFPVVVAACRALARPELNLRGVNATTHPVA